MLCRLYIYSLFIPLEFFTKLGSLRLEPYRVLLVIIFLQLLHKKITDKLYRILVCFVFLSTFSLFINHGLSVAIPSGGILYLEVCVSYMAGVTYVRNIIDHKKYFQILTNIYTLIAIPALIEFFTGYKVIHTLSERITGNIQLAPNLYTTDYIRLGFTRTTAVFSHPILYGISAVTIMPIIIAINENYRVRWTKLLINLFGIIIALITSITSAAVISLVLQQVFKKWYYVKNKIGSLKNITITSFFLAMIVIQLGSNQGLIKFLAMNLTLDPGTAYYRMLQWEFTSDDIANNFLFGIGFHDFSHPDWFADSVDSYWLLNMLQFGLFPQLALIFFYIKMLRKTFTKTSLPEKFNLLIAYRVMLISIIISGLTVDFFDRMQPLLYFILGTSSWLFIEGSENEDKNII